MCRVQWCISSVHELLQILIRLPLLRLMWDKHGSAYADCMHTILQPVSNTLQGPYPHSCPRPPPPLPLAPWPNDQARGMQ